MTARHAISKKLVKVLDKTRNLGVWHVRLEFQLVRKVCTHASHLMQSNPLVHLSMTTSGKAFKCNIITGV